MWGAVAKGIGGAIVGEVAVNLALNTSTFNKDVSKSVKGAEKSYSSAFNNIGKSGANMFASLGKLAVAAFSAKAIIDFSKQALQLGSDLQEVQNVVDVTYGSMSSKVNEFANQTIETAGLSETVAKKYMGTFGAMTKQFGFTTEQAYEMSKSITQLTGDVASFYNLTTDEAYTKLKSIWTGETETLKEIGVVMTQNALDQYALLNGYGKVTSAMTEQEKVALRYAFVQDKLSLASGDFVRTQDGWANQTRVLTLRWQQFMATVGQGLINILTPVVKMLNLLLSKLQSAANAFKNFTEALFGKKSSSSSGVASTVTNINDGLSGIGTNASDSADKVASAAKKMKKSISSVDELNIINSNKDASSGSSGMSDAVLGASGIGSLGDNQFADGLNENSEAVSKFAEKIKKLMKPLKQIDFTKFKQGLDKVYKSLKPLTKKLGEGLEWLWYNVLVPMATWTIEDFIPAFLHATAGALDALNGAIEFAKPYLQFLWEEFLQPIANWTGGVIVDVLTEIGNRWSQFGNWLSESAPTIEAVRKELEPFANAVGEIARFVGNILSLAWERWEPVLSAIWNYALKPLWENFLQPLLENYWSRLKSMAQIISNIFAAFNALMEGDWENSGESIVNGLTEGIENLLKETWVYKYLYDPIVNGFKKLFGIHSPSTVFYEFGINIMQGLWNGINSLKNWFMQKWETVKTWFTDIKPKVIAQWTTTKQNVAEWYSKVQLWWGEKKVSIAAALSTTWTTVQNWWSNVKAWWGDKTLSIRIKIGEVIGSIKGWINTNFIDKVNSRLPSFFPKIPRLFNGGYLGANNPQLAIVGDNTREGEIVAPESKIREQTKQGMKELMNELGNQFGIGQNIKFDLTIRQIGEDGRQIIKKINDVTIEDGQLSLII